MSKSKKRPVWAGPYYKENGGITQSMLQQWLVCRERSRIRLVEGLKGPETFREGLEYGNMFHEAEEAHGKGKDWKKAITNYATKLAKKYPLQQETIAKWMSVCLVQYEVYLDYWKGQKQLTRKKVEPLLREQVFCIGIAIPNVGGSRLANVYLKGKWDGVDLVGSGKNQSLALCENKAHGGMYYNPDKKASQLAFDFQTMFYVLTLEESAAVYQYGLPYKPVKNIFYNVMKRPLTGGKGSIVQKKPTKTNPKGESLPEFYERLGSVIREQPEEFFSRFDVQLDEMDVTRFYKQTLRNVLEQFCKWWDFVSSDEGLAEPFSSEINYRTPYGVFNPISAGLPTDYDTYLDEGSNTELEFNDSFYPELED